MATSTTSTSPYFDSLLKRRQQKKMSITQTYYLAHTARKKLTREASRADHDLRLLVGHANLLDSLMFDLADAEREQERWFNQTVSGATKASSNDRHIQWASTSTVVEEPEDWEEDTSDLDSDVSDSDSDDSDFDEADFVINTPVRRRSPSPVAPFHEDLLEEDDADDTDSDFEYDDAEDLDELSLTRSPSRQSPPELLADSDGESEDEATPPSPPQPTLDSFDEKKPATTAIALAEPEQDHLFEQGYFGAQEQSTIIEAY
ncbi:hypothetical protein PENANT_c010G02570 [Penicillium antarcticum]|uniref:Uncharacterized protein n=1 Tax=Penicillium antarcticum TaxID=416450 RepID=A0A1V6Q7R4_9EURO|nr:uncharacterized protein N7508_000519 [Penicillium antarcticum]KAJ5320236.1 hypothetical protein N7508_000519 [Penicillium antarcticum]OQD85270.1 hypothetical protein PENANT_c010G02570 [Penicillium antarcticum]